MHFFLSKYTCIIRFLWLSFFSICNSSTRRQLQAKQSIEFVEPATAPIFKTNLKDTTAKEGGYAHFEARLEPIGDPTLKVEWLKDGRPMEASELTPVLYFRPSGVVQISIVHLLHLSTLLLIFGIWMNWGII